MPPPKKLYSILFSTLLFIVCLLVPNQVFAQGEFETDYKVNYVVDSTGKASVTQEITLKNKTSNYYADKFELKIGSTKVSDVKASDATGPLQTEVKFENNITTISVKFNQKVIGINKTLPWTLSYSSQELASKSGQIWEVSIPRLAKTEDIGAYEATVTTPSVFGNLAFVVPQALSTKLQGATQQFTFSKDQLVESGIAMSFGEKQAFAFDLSYHLENKNLTSSIKEITLPPDNNYQKVVLEKLEPMPQNIEVDRDGNFIAKYKLGARSTIDITAKGFVEVFSRPFRNIYKPLTQEEKELYTQPQRYWEVDNAQVKDKAAELKTPKEIYNFVSTYLSYNNERLNSTEIERKGATSAFAAPGDSVCMEFTDLFIAIARSANIPAREVEGYAYSQNERLRPISLALEGKDILHAWPEYWDDNLGWVQIDPTWGSTSGGLDYFDKLDFNHLTFIHRGLSSTYPLPAGSFKDSNKSDKKDVDVQFAQELPAPTVVPELIIEAPNEIISGVPTKVQAIIKNAGSASVISRQVDLTSTANKQAISAKDNSNEITILPPFSSRVFNYSYQSKSFLTRSNDTLVLSFSDVQTTKPIQIVPVYNLFTTMSFAIAIATAAVIITSGLLLYKRLPNKLKNKR